MGYNDDILDVSAYLQSEIKKNLKETNDLIKDFSDIEDSYNEMDSRLDELLAESCEMAEKTGVDISDVKTEIITVEKLSSDFKIQISENYDYSAAFQDLLNKAHSEGFANTSPEDVLTAEEINKVLNYEDELDIRFCEQTGLTDKDVSILLISVAIRVLYFYIIKCVLTQNKDGGSDDKPLQNLTDEPVIDAMSNVDVDDISNKNALSQLLGLLGDGIVNSYPIKNERSILDGDIPFDIDDNEFFLRKDILGYHPLFGWVIGVLNILTDTVTTNKMDTYSVVNSIFEEKIHLGQKIQPLCLLLPLVNDLGSNKDSVIAAVVRQAEVMNVTSAPKKDVVGLLKNIISEEEHNFELLDKADVVSRIIPVDLNTLSLGGIIRDSAISAFMNKLITAVHAVHYKPEIDGDLKSFSVRTYKIIAISSAVAASVNSLPAFVTEDYTKVDMSGIIMALIAVFNSAKFWIQAKADYLVSEYKIKIDKAFAEVNKFFEILDNDNEKV